MELLNILLILGLGLLAGLAARWIIPGRQPLSLAETAVLGAIGSALGGTIAELLFDWVLGEGSGPGLAISALVGSVIVIGAVAFLADHFGWRQAPEPSVVELIAAGESHEVEFKSTARWNLHTDQKDDRMELAVAKTIAGFLNGDGGTLIIGLDDEGHAIGLDKDLSTMKAPDNDRYELWLTDHLERTLGKPALAFLSIEFTPFLGEEVVSIRVGQSDRPVFLDEPKGGRTADFYVRMGNSTRKMLTDEFDEYRSSRWK